MKKLSLYLLLSVVAACSDDGGATPPSFDARTSDASLAVSPDARPDAGAGADARPLTGDILADLRGIDGMTVSERSTTVSGYRFFEIEYDQPIDHMNPTGARFQQRIMLMHRSYTAPTVLITNGYFVAFVGRRTELTALANANQVSVEHRYFVPSRPDPTDWSKLDIWQAATDHHRITQALKRLYPSRWLNTGASKSGMTAVYHRRFYPDDVDGTVAYVAPLSFGAPDPRYVAFVDAAGPGEDCRQKLRAFQRAVLSSKFKPAMLSEMQQLSTEFDKLGREKALEHAVLELPFSLWQYHSASSCSVVPTANDSAAKVWAFLDDIADVGAYGDDEVIPYGPYYYQAANQLGFPQINEAAVADLLKFPGTDIAGEYMPAGTTPSYDPSAMVDIDTWVKTQGRSLLFIYGQYDPWTAGAFSLGAGTTDSFKLIVPEGNHGSSIGDLGGADKNLALDAIRRWANLSALPSGKPTREQLLPMIEGRRRM